MSGNRSTGGGVGFTGMLQLAFIVLKLLGVIEWSWVWVLAPTWIGILLAFVILVVFLILKRLLQ